MVERKSSRQPSHTEKVRDARNVKKFLEELSWVLNSHSNLDFRLIANAEIAPTAGNNRHLAQHVSKNPNIHFLVGALPTIFSDEKFFPNNEDIAEFASDALQLPIARWEKRSRYELIGFIVCETVKLDDERLARLVDVLSKIVSDDPKARGLFQDRKVRKLSWNEIIQQLSQGGKE